MRKRKNIMTLSLVCSDGTKPQVRKYFWENGRVFILNPLGRGAIFTLLQDREIAAQCLLTDSETYVVDLLFTFYPDYAPIEELLAVLKDVPVATCLSSLSQAADSSDYQTYFTLTRSVRYTVSLCRKHLMPFGIEIHAIDKTGYEIMIPKQRRKPSINNESQRQHEVRLILRNERGSMSSGQEGMALQREVTPCLVETIAQR
jgi:hypothetical protein